MKTVHIGLGATVKKLRRVIFEATPWLICYMLKNALVNCYFRIEKPTTKVESHGEICKDGTQMFLEYNY